MLRESMLVMNVRAGIVVAALVGWCVAGCATHTTQGGAIDAASSDAAGGGAAETSTRDASFPSEDAFDPAMTTPEASVPADASVDVLQPTGMPDAGAALDAGSSDAGIFLEALPFVMGCPAGQTSVRARDGVMECVRVGAFSRGAAAMSWPAAEVTDEPVVYVDPAAAPGGNGTMAMPYRTLEEAFARNDVQRVLLRDGVHVVNGALLVRRSMRVQGVSAVGDVRSLVRVEGSGVGFDAQGPSALLALQDVAIQGATTGLSVRASGGATLRLQNVDVSRSGVQLTAAARLSADAVSIRDCVRSGLELRAGSAAVVKGLEVRNVSGPGVYAVDSVVSLSESLINRARPGIALAGASPGGVADQLDRVSIRDCVHTGLWIDGAGRSVNGSFMEIVRTEQFGTLDSASGDGVLVQRGARFVLDPGLSRLDAGRGSYVAANRRAGVLAFGENTTIALTGTLVEQNYGPGVMVQERASARTLLALKVRQNHGAGGLFTTQADLFEIRDCVFEGTTRGDGSLFTLRGIGVVLAGLTRVTDPSALVGIRDCVFTANVAADVMSIGARIDLSGPTSSSWRVSADNPTDVSGNFTPSATPAPSPSERGTIPTLRLLSSTLALP